MNVSILENNINEYIHCDELTHCAIRQTAIGGASSCHVSSVNGQIDEDNVSRGMMSRHRKGVATTLTRLSVIKLEKLLHTWDWD